ncbi:alpha/beta fold hydrolase [Agromyces protaetiae]|uniref:Alpha/beta fold hydrolase n=1 Tax=Agromyces protaetiae TaxID=2509455 RepID=A0A4P6FEH6_9MICO|nr:alpha/beta hydrolase [Agromyces protaetiae]QAY74660.1 alpha/beta fold hydrolase [Agromyces protaetiae]
MSMPGLPVAPTLHAEASDDVLIAYRVYGLDRADASHPPVLLVHGFASNAAYTWLATGWVRALEQAGRAVVTVDLRGHGDSDRPTEAGSYRPSLLGEDLVAVLDSAGVDVVDVVGYSLGARVVSVLLDVAPERVRRVVIGGAGPTELLANGGLLAEIGSLMRREELGEHAVVGRVLGQALLGGTTPELLLAMAKEIAGANLVLPPELPVLFVAGELDPVPLGVDELARERGSELVVIPGRDHVSSLTSRIFKDAAIGFFE